MPDDPVAATDATSASGISRRWRIFPRPARSGGRASCASPNGSPDFETARRAKLSALDAEIGGGIAIPFGDGEFKLTVRADRIECLLGRPLRHPRLQDRRAADREAGPHRAVAAAHARSRDPAPGRLQGDPGRRDRWRELLYVRLRGGAAAGEDNADRVRETAPSTSRPTTRWRGSPDCSPSSPIPSTPYYSLLHPMWTTHYGTYDHLARVQEWSLTGGDEDETRQAGE